MEEKKYLSLLASKYQTPEEVASEIINLSAIRSLPKGTEYFFSDLHGEYEAFLYLLKSASGMIRTKIDAVFGKTLTKAEIIRLEQLIYYPKETLEKYSRENKLDDEWRRIPIYSG